MGPYGWDHMSGWGWFTVVLGMLLLAALVAAGVVLLARVGQRRAGTSPAPSPRAAQDLLAERFARGEIDEDEYRSRLATLTGARPGAGPST